MMIKCKRIFEIYIINFVSFFSLFIWYMFPLKACIYTIQCIKEEITVTWNMIMDVDPWFIHLDQAITSWNAKLLKFWKKIEANLIVRKLVNDENRLHSKILIFLLLYFYFCSRMKKIVTLLHIFHNTHLGLIAT